MQVLENIDLSTIAFYKIGGKTKFLVSVEDAADVKDGLRFVKEHADLPVRVLSLGANLLIPDEDFVGITILLKGNGSSFQLSGDTVSCFAGETFDELIRYSFEHNLIGLEWAGGLPSSVGGAVRGNAGCFGSEIKESVLSVQVIDLRDPILETKTYSNDESQFGYRESFFKHHPDLVIVSATFQLKKATDKEVEKAREVYQKNINYRKKNHPLEYPSCGSVFKNIVDPKQVEKIIAVWPDVKELSQSKWHSKIAVGYVIHRLGFSGKRVGGAMVSQKHANYIVNVDNAKAHEVKDLVEQIQAKFKETFGFIPDPEVMII